MSGGWDSDKTVVGASVDGSEWNTMVTVIDGKAEASSPTITGTITTDNISASGSISANYLSLTTDLAVTSGGTGASTAADARTNLGLVIGTNVQAWDADLDTWAGKTAPTGTVVGTSDSQALTNKTINANLNTISNLSASTISTGSVSDTEFGYLDGVTSSIQTQLNNKQALDATLTALAGVTTTADKLIYATASDTFTTTDLTPTARALLDDTTFSAMRTTLGLAISTDVQPYDVNTTKLGNTTTGSGSTLVLSTTPTFTTSIKTPAITVPSDSTTAMQVFKADGSTAIVVVDSSNQRVGVNTTPSSSFHATGVAPASVGTTPGTTAATTGAITLLAATGGATTIATTGTGGIGGAVSITAGAGGVADSATTSATGGAGGALTITSGTGGLPNVNATTVTAGNSGAITISTPDGSTLPSLGSTRRGGTSGAITIRTGAAGGATNGGTVRVVGALSITSGAGGAGSGTGTVNGGTAGAINITCGQGGATTAAAGNGGNGGSLSLLAGDGNTSTNGTGGSGGAFSATSGSGYDGATGGGNNGAISISQGSCGAATTSGNGGIGQAVQITLGNGGNAIGAGTGGGAGPFQFFGGTGGTGGTTGTGGAGTSIRFKAGSGGTTSGAGTGGAGGNVCFWGGNGGTTTGGTTGAQGHIYLGYDTIGASLSSANVAVAQSAVPTAKIHIGAGTATAGTAPLKLTAGTVLSSPEAGTIEFDGSNFFLTI